MLIHFPFFVPWYLVHVFLEQRYCLELPAHKDNKNIQPDFSRGPLLCSAWRLGLLPAPRAPPAESRALGAAVEWADLRSVGRGAAAFAQDSKWEHGWRVQMSSQKCFPSSLGGSFIARTLPSSWSEPRPAMPWRFWPQSEHLPPLSLPLPPSTLVTDPEPFILCPVLGTPRILKRHCSALVSWSFMASCSSLNSLSRSIAVSRPALVSLFSAPQLYFWHRCYLVCYLAISFLLSRWHVLFNLLENRLQSLCLLLLLEKDSLLVFEFLMFVVQEKILYSVR